MEMGVIVTLHIRRWRAKTRLEFADLGLSRTVDDEVYNHLIRLGDKKLLPKIDINGKKTSYVDILDSIESRARRLLELNGFETFYGRFVPCTMYQTWKEESEQIKIEYLRIRDDICDRYTEIVANLLTEYRAMAKDAYSRTDRKISEDTFVNNFVDSVRSLVPTKERIFDSFDYETDIGFVPLPSDYERDEARADKVRRMAELSEEADRGKINAIRRMNEDAISQLRTKKLAMVDSFMDSLQRQLRNQMYDAVVDVLESIKRNDGKLVGKSASQLRNLTQSIEGLNFYGDKDIDSMVKTIKGKLGNSDKDRDVADITNTLQQIGTLTRANLMSLGESPRMVRGTGIDYEADEVSLRTVRQSLGIVTEVDMGLTASARQNRMGLSEEK
jgi:hypothetical protein